MKLYVRITENQDMPPEYQSDVAGEIYLPDGSTHHDVTKQFNKIMSLWLGYSVGDKEE